MDRTNADFRPGVYSLPLLIHPMHIDSPNMDMTKDNRQTRSAERLDDQKKYRTARIFNNFNTTKFSNDIIEHHKYIANLYERDPNIISENLTEIIQTSLDYQAPVRTIQVNKKIA